MDDGAAHAVVERDSVLAEAHEAAHPVSRGGDFHRARAVLDGDGFTAIASEEADESTHARVRARVGGVNVAVDVEVAELGIALRADERSYELGIDVCLGTAIVEGQLVAASIERAGEPLVALARHGGDGDVLGQHDGLAAEFVAFGHVVAELIPAICVLDGVGVAVDGEIARRTLCPCLCGGEHAEQHEGRPAHCADQPLGRGREEVINGSFHCLYIIPVSFRLTDSRLQRYKIFPTTSCISAQKYNKTQNS